MLDEIFPSRKPSAGASLAVAVRTHRRGFGAAVLAVDFALVSEKTAGVGKAENLLASALFADVGTIVLVHVFSEGAEALARRGKGDILGQLTTTRTSW